MEEFWHIAAVEIFKADTLQWYITEPLPVACEDIPLASIGNTCYALGGWRNDSESHLNQALRLYATVDDLLYKLPLTVVSLTFHQLGRHYLTLQPIN